ncbi:MAG: hypothetical protein DMF75_14360 [Acidobacteria bacterium]|nr:MAG: hypothetical protein DMF75_14360 [Acidobacteriota bacterium]
MTDHRLIRDTLQSLGDVTELYEVTTFTGHRNGKTVTIRILDLGADCPNPSERFACEVIQDDGREVGGNNARTVDEAIGIVHWGDLD